MIAILQGKFQHHLITSYKLLLYILYIYQETSLLGQFQHHLETLQNLLIWIYHLIVSTVSFSYHF